MPGYVVFAQDKVIKAAPETAETTGATPDAPAKPQGGLPVEQFAIIGVIFFIFYFVVLRPQKRRAEREREERLNLLDKNDKVLTIGGIYGTIISVHDKEDEIVVKVDDNTRLKMTKASIGRNITREEKLKAEKEAKTQEKTK